MYELLFYLLSLKKYNYNYFSFLIYIDCDLFNNVYVLFSMLNDKNHYALILSEASKNFQIYKEIKLNK